MNIARPFDGFGGIFFGIVRSKPVQAAVAAGAAAAAFNAISNPSDAGASPQVEVVVASSQAAPIAPAAQVNASAKSNPSSGEKLDNAGLPCLSFEITFDLNGCGKHAIKAVDARSAKKSGQSQPATPSKSCDVIDSWLGKCGPNAGAKSGSSTKSSTSKAPTTSCDSIDNFLGKCVNGVPVPKKQSPWSNPDCNIFQKLAFIDDCQKKEPEAPKTPPSSGERSGSW